MTDPAWARDLRALERALSDGLSRPLPGPDAHVRLAISPRPGWLPGQLPEDCRPAAALVLLCAHSDGPRVVLTERALDLKRHGGQISLPGGRVEPGESLEDAARREAREEIGLDPATVRLVGALTPIHIPVSAFILHPFVAILDEPASEWLHDRGEVARVIEVPLAELADPANQVIDGWVYQGTPYRVPLFAVRGCKVWGATAMILAELLTILGQPPEMGPA